MEIRTKQLKDAEMQVINEIDTVNDCALTIDASDGGKIKRVAHKNMAHKYAGEIETLRAITLIDCMFAKTISGVPQEPESLADAIKAPPWETLLVDMPIDSSSVYVGDLLADNGYAGKGILWYNLLEVMTEQNGVVSRDVSLQYESVTEPVKDMVMKALMPQEIDFRTPYRLFLRFIPVDMPEKL